jgi:prepilin-type N-terminal cleavage/methylation domain-containing protein
MSLQSIKEKGFTIVELLIVIVVIGVLAAIVIVAYNGITNSAKDSGFLSDAQGLAKIAEVVNANTGSYPTGTDTATLTTSFDSTATSKIPGNIDLLFAAAAPTNAVALTNAQLATKVYSVDPCTPAGAGVKIYYPQTGGTLGVISVGTTTAGCA